MKFFTFALLLLGLSGCELAMLRTPFIAVSGVNVTPAAVTVGLGHIKTAKLTASITPARATNASLGWTSGNASKVTVSNGTVTGVGVTVTPVPISVVSVEGSKTASSMVTVVPGVSLSTNALSVVQGAGAQVITATIVGDVTSDTIDWAITGSGATLSNQNPLDVTVNFTGTGTATITATPHNHAGTYVADSCAVTVFSSGGTAMRVGVNLIDTAFGPIFNNAYIQNIYKKNFYPDWTSLHPKLFGAGAPAATASVWEPNLLTDLAAFNGPIRFMDWNETNWNPIVHWADRIQPTENQLEISAGAGKWIPVVDPIFTQVIQVNFGSSASTDHYSMAGKYGGIESAQAGTDVAAGHHLLRGVGYEWMIDLCNRTGHDLWLNIPYAADDNFVTNLATLMRDNLDPALKVWVEYGNETWNPQFMSAWWCNAQGSLAPVDPNDAHWNFRGSTTGLPVGSAGDFTASGSGKNPFALGQGYTVYRSMQIWRIFATVFGGVHLSSPSTQSVDERFVRVLCAAGNVDTMVEEVKDVMFNGTTHAGNYDINTEFNATYNSDKQVADIIATNTYVGSDATPGSYSGAGIQGSAPANLHVDIDHTISVFILPVQNKFKKFGFVFWGSYEGGNGTQPAKGRSTIMNDPLVYNENLYMLQQYKANGLKQFNQYTLYNSAWGLKIDNADPVLYSWNAFKYFNDPVNHLND